MFPLQSFFYLITIIVLCFIILFEKEMVSLQDIRTISGISYMKFRNLILREKLLTPILENSKLQQIYKSNAIYLDYKVIISSAVLLSLKLRPQFTW